MAVQFFLSSLHFSTPLLWHINSSPLSGQGKAEKSLNLHGPFFVTSVFFRALRITSPVAVDFSFTRNIFPWRRFRFKVKLLNKQVEYGNEYWYSFVGTNNFAKDKLSPLHPYISMLNLNPHNSLHIS